jgi:hypothetical protein
MITRIACLLTVTVLTGNLSPTLAQTPPRTQGGSIHAAVDGHSSVSTHLVAQRQDATDRYRWHDGRWWYQMRDGRWMYWTNDRWSVFDPTTYDATIGGPRGDFRAGYRWDDDYVSPRQRDFRYQYGNRFDDRDYRYGRSYDRRYRGYRGYGHPYQDWGGDYGRYDYGGYYGAPGYGFGQPGFGGYYSRGTIVGEDIGGRIGGAIGGDYGAGIGAAIGAGIGADIEAEVEDREWRRDRRRHGR